MRSNTQKIPVFGGIGNRDVIGYASGLRSAVLLIRSKIAIPKGFALHVWERQPHMCEILDQPIGFVYAVSYDGGRSCSNQ